MQGAAHVALIDDCLPRNKCCTCCCPRCDLESIAKHGGWSGANDHLIKSYNTAPQPSAVSTAGGHVKDTYTLARGRVPPPPELLKKIFPFAEKWRADALVVRCDAGVVLVGVLSVL